ncbi:MAG: S-layer protein [Paenibacillus sp.]|nr:S-layer protein [Paenibacillus sp.]
MKRTNSSYTTAEHIPERERSGKSLLNKSMLKKTSSLLAAVMIISMLVPIMAFAASFIGFKNVTYNSDGTVTGQVYFDSERVTDSVYLNVYSNGNYDSSNAVTTATYATYENGYYYYNFNFTVANATYNPIELRGLVNGSQWGVSDAVYKQNPPGCTVNCGGGGVIIPPASDVINVTNGTVNSDTLKNALAAYNNVTLKITGDTVQIPASALIDAAAKDGVTITIIGDNGTYILPLSVLKLDDLAKELGVDVKDLKINVGITKVTGDQATALADAIADIGGTSVAAAVDFTLNAEGADGKKVNIESFGDTYVSRKLTLTSTPTKPTTGVVFDPVNGKVSFVPSTFETVDGKSIATIKRNSNSIYTVIELEKSFTDINAHWAQSNVELLASKLIVDGVTDQLFEPDRNITRAEFAALLVRSLGLQLSSGTSSFSDVAAGEWFTGVVGAAAQAKLVDGYEDGTFRPNAQITREELAAMVVRALKYAGMEIKVDAAKQASLLAAWSDSNQIVWGHNEIAAALEAGIVDGMTDTTLAVRENATRAQSATMLKRFLTKADFID